MHLRARCILLTLALAAGQDYACETMVFGYNNRPVAPYYLGSGGEQADPPGASVELIQEIAASAGCPFSSMRMPASRLEMSLESGTINAAALSEPDDNRMALAYPLDKHGQRDSSRGLQQYTVILVRRGDHLPADLDPQLYFRSHKLAAFHGATFGRMLRAAGYTVDDGAVDAASNIEKLRLSRVDGVAIAVTSPDEMDAEVAAHYGSDIVRLGQPIHVSTVWLLFNPAYYERNHAQVEAMWNWIGSQGRARFTALLKKYDKQH